MTHRKTTASSEHLFAMTRGLTILFGVVQIGIGIWARELGDTVVKNALTIAGFSAGLLLGVFALGVLTRRAGQASALIGGAIGLCVLSFFQFGSAWHGLKIAFPWFALIGAATTFVTGYAISWVCPKQGVVS